MIIVLKPEATQAEIDHVIEKIEAAGLKAHLSRGEYSTIIGAIGDEAALRNLPLEILPGESPGLVPDSRTLDSLYGERGWGLGNLLNVSTIPVTTVTVTDATHPNLTVRLGAVRPGAVPGTIGWRRHLGRRRDAPSSTGSQSNPRYPRRRMNPSSVKPSQSSSIRLQTSADGSPGTQPCGTPSTQLSTVRRQAPMPQLVWPSPSSM